MRALCPRRSQLAARPRGSAACPPRGAKRTAARHTRGSRCCRGGGGGGARAGAVWRPLAAQHHRQVGREPRHTAMHRAVHAGGRFRLQQKQQKQQQRRQPPCGGPAGAAPPPLPWPPSPRLHPATLPGWHGDSMRSGRMMPPEPLRGVRVSVLLRSAHGMPPDARAFAKVACGSNRFRTFHVAGVSGATGRVHCSPTTFLALAECHRQQQQWKRRHIYNSWCTGPPSRPVPAPGATSPLTPNQPPSRATHRATRPCGSSCSRLTWRTPTARHWCSVSRAGAQWASQTVRRAPEHTCLMGPVCALPALRAAAPLRCMFTCWHQGMRPPCRQPGPPTPTLPRHPRAAGAQRAAAVARECDARGVQRADTPGAEAARRALWGSWRW